MSPFSSSGWRIFPAEGFVSVCFSPVSGGFGTLEENASILEKTADSVLSLIHI